MKIIAKYNSKLVDEENNILAQFKITDYNSKVRIQELDKTKNYQLEIKEVKSKRSLQQNKLLWVIINDCAEIEKEDPMKIYIDLLKNTNCAYDWIKTAKLETIDKLKEVYRATEFIRVETIRNRKEYVYKVYLGSSKYTVAEMNLLIDEAINYANNYNLSYDKNYYYE